MTEFSIDGDELARLVGRPEGPRIYDVRRRTVFDAATAILPTARWRDSASAPTWAKQVPKAASVVVYCAQGHHLSQLAAATLREAGINARFLDGGIDSWCRAGGTTQLKTALPARDEEAPSRWVTRIRPKIDRIACPWLIRRFIDRDAEFYFVRPEEVVEVARGLNAIPYDIEGVDFGHEGELCTFDTLLARFGLGERALLELALIVRGADTARPDLAPEAAGLLAISLGNSAIAGADDHIALELGFPVYDALLAWRRFAAQETHNWPSKRV